MAPATVNHDVIIFIALISVVTVAVAAAVAARAKLIILILRLRGPMCTEEAGEDGVGPEQGTAKWGAAPIHACSGVSASFKEKRQHTDCLGFYCKVQRGPATCRLRFIEVSSSIPEQPDHLCIFVDDCYMEWGVAIIVFSFELQPPVFITRLLFILWVGLGVRGNRGMAGVWAMVLALSEVGI